MKRLSKTVITAYMAHTAFMVAPVLAEQAGSPIPFGGYHKDGKCGCYGTKSAIKTIEEARKVIEGFLAGHDLRIGVMNEFPRFFKAEVLDGNGVIRDVVIVDKINGRVRSIN